MASSSSMPLPLPRLVKDEEPINWLELPPELTSSIMLRLGTFDVLENAQKVCTSWRRVSKEPSMWRKIDMGNLQTFEYDLDRMCRHAVDRSEGCLVEISIGTLGTDDLLNYIADRLWRTANCRCDCFELLGRNQRREEVRSEKLLRLVRKKKKVRRWLNSLKANRLVCIWFRLYRTSAYPMIHACRAPNLRSLRLVMEYPLTKTGVKNAFAKLSLLEELELEVSMLWSELDLNSIGHCCPNLKSFKLISDYVPNLFLCYNNDDDDDDGLAIAESMPQLHYLQLIGNKLTDTGLNAMLDKCTHLEHLDLRKCHIKLSSDLEKRCLERVKDFRRPNDSDADQLINLFQELDLSIYYCCSYY